MKTWEERVRTAEAEKGEKLSLDELLELARGHTMTPWERHQQRISFAMAMVPFSDTTITREDLERAAQVMWGDHLQVVQEGEEDEEGSA